MCSKVLNGHIILTDTSITTILAPEMTYTPKNIARECGIDKQLSFHLARHTYATTICLSNGVSLETLSKMLGHKNITTTQIYASAPRMVA